MSMSTSPGISDARAHAWLRARGFRPLSDRESNNRYSLKRGDAYYDERRRLMLRAFRCVPSSYALRMDIETSPLILAIAEGNFPVAEWLLHHGLSVSQVDPNGMSPMLMLCIPGNLNGIMWLFAHGAFGDVCRSDKSGATPMHKACYKGNIELADWLLQHGADRTLRARHKCGTTPMFSAFYNKRFEMVCWLIRNGAWHGASDLEVRKDTDLLDSRPRDMIYRGHISRVQKLVQWAGVTRTTSSAFFVFLSGTYEERVQSTTGNCVDPRRKGSAFLWMINGYNDHLKRRIASFLGPLVVEKELGYIREAAAILKRILVDEARWRLRPEHIGLGPGFGCCVQ